MRAAATAQMIDKAVTTASGTQGSSATNRTGAGNCSG